MFTLKQMNTRGDIEELVADSVDTRFVVLEESETKELIACGYVKRCISPKYKQHSHHGYLGFMFVDPAFRGMP